MNLAATKAFPKLERYGVIVAFSIYVAFQINAALHHGSWGQDFQMHRDWIADAVMDPWKYFTHYDNGRTNPPLYHLLGALIYNATGGVHCLEYLALLTAALNAGALLLLYRIVRTQMQEPLIRLSCFIFLLFLPFAMIHAIVLASDALAPPIFIAVLYLLTTLGAADSRRGYFGRILGIGLLLTVGVGTKFTFGSLILASFLSFGALVRTGSISRQRFLTGVLMFAVVPGIPAFAEFYQYRTQQTYNNGINKTGSEMNLRSIVLFRQHDLHVLDAPPYSETASVPAPAQGDTPPIEMELLLKNKYSYPALLELAIFTDIMNIYQYDPYDSYFGRRSSSNQAKMRLAVRTGTVFFAFVTIAAAFVLVKSCYVTFVVARREGLAMSIMGVSASLYYLNIVSGFPFVRAYYAGYWLPRLVQPALLCFVVMAFTALDGWLLNRRHALAWACLAAVLFQSALHASFLWPWGELKESGGEIEAQVLRPEAPAPSEPACLTCPSVAEFVRTDATTCGDWKGHYGLRGFAIANDSKSFLEYAQVTLPQAVFTWVEDASGERRALRNLKGRTARIASMWYGLDSLQIHVATTDGRKRQLALYFVDWDTTRRAQRIDILDADTDRVLDSRTVVNFHDGQYVVWSIRGRLRIRIARTAEPNAVVSGVFLD